MKLEEQVVGLDLSKRLKELGVKQESLVVWADLDINCPKLVNEGWGFEGEWCSAFTVAELGEILKWRLDCYYSELVSTKGVKHNPPIVEWVATPDYGEYREDVPEIIGNTEADARAELLIHLIEEGIITIEK